MRRPYFLLTRFTHGSAGKFLSTVLQTSKKVDHWSEILQRHKDSNIYKDLTIQYVKRSFPSDHTSHLRIEPMVPYNDDLYSTGYDRGNDIDLQKYIDNIIKIDDRRVLKCLDQGLLMNLVLNKPTVPAFCQGSKSVIVTVTSVEEREWLFDRLWLKHFLVTDTSIKYLPADPDYCNFASLSKVLQFKNQFEFPLESKDELYEKYIVNNHTNSWYFNPDRFIEYDRIHNIQHTFLSLSTLLDHRLFVTEVQRIFNELDLGPMDRDLIGSMHRCWLASQA